jgi:predicted Zn-dependent peptidase
MNFDKKYNKWLSDCKKELENKGFTKQEIKKAEICENGQVYFGRGSLFDITQPNFVTPWKE